MRILSRNSSDMPRLRDELKLKFFLTSRSEIGEGARLLEEYREQLLEHLAILKESEMILATALNESGDVCGWSRIEPSLRNKGFVYRASVMTYVGFAPGRTSSDLWSINKFGHAVGTSGNEAYGKDPVAVIWHDQLIELGGARRQPSDVMGRLIATPVAGMRSAGNHKFTWDGLMRSGRCAPAGVYLVKLTTPDFVGSSRLVVVW